MNSTVDPKTRCTDSLISLCEQVAVCCDLVITLREVFFNQPHAEPDAMTKVWNDATESMVTLLGRRRIAEAAYVDALRALFPGREKHLGIIQLVIPYATAYGDRQITGGMGAPTMLDVVSGRAANAERNALFKVVRDAMNPILSTADQRLLGRKETLRSLLFIYAWNPRYENSRAGQPREFKWDQDTMIEVPHLRARRLPDWHPCA